VVQRASTTVTPKIRRYTLRRGDTLASIARQFNVSTDDLLRWNSVSPRSLMPGQTLTIQVQLAQNS
jgi:membrane-bound lytic murein transglycosylase D